MKPIFPCIELSSALFLFFSQEDCNQCCSFRFWFIVNTSSPMKRLLFVIRRERLKLEILDGKEGVEQVLSSLAFLIAAVFC